MTMLSERTRRALTLTLFFFLGPALLGVLGYRLFARSTSVALTKEESRLSQRTGFQVEIEEREYLRPGSQRLLNVEFTSSQTGKSAFFCPEIYLVRENDLHRSSTNFQEASMLLPRQLAEKTRRRSLRLFLKTLRPEFIRAFRILKLLPPDVVPWYRPSQVATVFKRIRTLKRSLVPYSMC